MKMLPNPDHIFRDPVIDWNTAARNIAIIDAISNLYPVPTMADILRELAEEREEGEANDAS